MKVSTKKNDGVSPVIGTILLVAITVVLVAIISAVVMGMTGGIGTSHVVGVKVVPGDNISSHSSLFVTITGGDTTGLKTIAVYNGSTPIGEATSPIVGKPIKFDTETKLLAGQGSISVVGQFADGNQTIYTGTINLA